MGWFSKARSTASALTFGASEAVIAPISAAAKSLMPKTPGPAAGSPAAIRLREQHFGLREQNLRQQAAAGGAMRSESDADLLGEAPAAPKRRKASRALLG